MCCIKSIFVEIAINDNKNFKFYITTQICIFSELYKNKIHYKDIYIYI